MSLFYQRLSIASGMSALCLVPYSFKPMAQYAQHTTDRHIASSLLLYYFATTPAIKPLPLQACALLSAGIVLHFGAEYANAIPAEKRGAGHESQVSMSHLAGTVLMGWGILKVMFRDD